MPLFVRSLGSDNGLSATFAYCLRSVSLPSVVQALQSKKILDYIETEPNSQLCLT